MLGTAHGPRRSPPGPGRRLHRLRPARPAPGPALCGHPGAGRHGAGLHPRPAGDPAEPRTGARLLPAAAAAVQRLADRLAGLPQQPAADPGAGARRRAVHRLLRRRRHAAAAAGDALVGRHRARRHRRPAGCGGRRSRAVAAAPAEAHRHRAAGREPGERCLLPRALQAGGRRRGRQHQRHAGGGRASPSSRSAPGASASAGWSAS